jgi:hypothetical protein
MTIDHVCDCDDCNPQPYDNRCQWQQRHIDFMLSDVMLAIGWEFRDRVDNDRPNAPLQCVELLLKQRDALLAERDSLQAWQDGYLQAMEAPDV